MSWVFAFEIRSWRHAVDTTMRIKCRRRSLPIDVLRLPLRLENNLVDLEFEPIWWKNMYVYAYLMYNFCSTMRILGALVGRFQSMQKLLQEYWWDMIPLFGYSERMLLSTHFRYIMQDACVRRTYTLVEDFSSAWHAHDKWESHATAASRSDAANAWVSSGLNYVGTASHPIHHNILIMHLP